MEKVISFFEHIEISRKQVHQNLTMFPLIAPDGNKPEYLTLEQAIDEDVIHITEIDRDGSVPELKLINRGRKKVLIIEGEELIGAKQNRIVNSSFLIAGKSALNLPVSCVEQGRWSRHSKKFTPGRKVMPASIRQEHQADVKESLRMGRGHRSNQGRIWSNIAAKSARMNVDAPTGAMADMFEQYDERLKAFSGAFQLVDWQIGAVFAINGRVLGLEGFGCHDTFQRFFVKLIQSYTLDALDHPDLHIKSSVPPYKAHRFIASAAKAKGERHPSIGIGDNLIFESRNVSGTALIESKRLLHMSVFKKGRKDVRPGLGYLCSYKF